MSQAQIPHLATRTRPNILIALWFILLSALCFHCPWSIACYICGERVLWNFYYLLWDQTCPQECIPESQTTRSRNLTVMVRMVLTQLTPGDTPCPREGAVAVLCWSSHEVIPHVQGKRNPSKTVGDTRGHQRADTLKPYSQETSQSNYTRTTALSNSMKLSHASGATQDVYV